MHKFQLSVVLALISLLSLWGTTLPAMAEGTPALTRIDTTFTSQGTTCAAWLYLPQGTTKAPIVVMAHGFGLERAYRLPAYAEHFAANGMACLLFDYRGFGESESEPRNYVSPSRHLEDWQAAISFARSLDSVDTKRIALWGTSFSGGHVLATAAQTPGIAAVVAQVPFVDGIATTLSFSPKYQMQGLYHGMWDVFSAAFTNHRHYVPIVGDPSTFAMMNTPDALPGVEHLLPADTKIKNACPAVIALTLPLYRPIHTAGKIKSPTMIVYAEKDTLIPAKAVRKTAARIKNSVSIGMPIGHFDVYQGAPFEQAIVQETEFLRQHLGLNVNLVSAEHTAL